MITIYAKDLMKYRDLLMKPYDFKGCWIDGGGEPHYSAWAHASYIHVAPGESADGVVNNTDRYMSVWTVASNGVYLKSYMDEDVDIDINADR